MRVDELLPHAGRARLICRVVHHDDESIVCEGVPPADPEHPLRCAGHVGTAAAIEYGAQAMAIHGTLDARRGAHGEPARVGYLVAVHDVRFGCDTLEGITEPLRVAARRVLAMGDRVSYEFEVFAASTLLASGRANVSLRAGLAED